MRLCCNCGKPFDHASWQCPSCLYEPKRLGGHLAFAPELAEKSEGFDASYFGRLAELEPGSFWFRSRNRLLCWALEHYFPDATNFLEIAAELVSFWPVSGKSYPDLAWGAAKFSPRA